MKPIGIATREARATSCAVTGRLCSMTASTDTRRRLSDGPKSNVTMLRAYCANCTGHGSSKR